MLGDENNNELFDLANFDAKKTALLVIDELGDPTGTPLEQTLLPAIENTARIAAAARRAGVPVIFTNDAHIPGLDRELLLWGDHGIAGTPEAQTSPLLDPKEGDFTIEKRRYSAFSRRDCAFCSTSSASTRSFAREWTLTSAFAIRLPTRTSTITTLSLQETRRRRFSWGTRRRGLSTSRPAMPPAFFLPTTSWRCSRSRGRA